MDHIILLAIKLRKLSYALKHLKHLLNINLVKKVYKSLMEFILKHGIITWAVAKKIPNPTK